MSNYVKILLKKENRIPIFIFVNIIAIFTAILAHLFNVSFIYCVILIGLSIILCPFWIKNVLAIKKSNLIEKNKTEKHLSSLSFLWITHYFKEGLLLLFCIFILVVIMRLKKNIVSPDLDKINPKNYIDFPGGIILPDINYFSSIGCFVLGTKIILPNRDSKKIEDFYIGDKLLTYNIKNKSFSIGSVAKITKEISKEILIINNSIMLTKSQLVYANNKYVTAKSLKVGDKLFDVNENTITLNSIELSEEENIVVNLETDNKEGFFIEGILTGRDMRLLVSDLYIKLDDAVKNRFE